MTHDVEKRFDRPGTFHEAAMYVGVVVAVAGVVFAIYASTWKESVVVASMVPAILFAGGIGAFVKTYRVWKEEGAWPAWQGARQRRHSHRDRPPDAAAEFPVPTDRQGD